MIEYATEFCELGYQIVVQDFLTLIDMEKMKKLVFESFLSQERMEAFYRLISRRVRELTRALEVYEHQKK